MPYRKNPKIDTIPDGLISTKEAIGMLGIKRDNRHCRLAHLDFAYVAYNKTRIKLYRRSDVESLLPSAAPEGYEPLKKIAAEFGYINGLAHVRKVLERAGVPRVLHICHHPYYVYPGEQAREVLAAFASRQAR